MDKFIKQSKHIGQKVINGGLQELMEVNEEEAKIDEVQEEENGELLDEEVDEEIKEDDIHNIGNVIVWESRILQQKKEKLQEKVKEFIKD